MATKKKMKIGIVGCGAIGSSLAKRIVSDFGAQAELAGLNDADMDKAYALAESCGSSGIPVFNLKDLIKKSDLIIEATHMSASFDIAKKTVTAGKHIIIMSVGGILQRYRQLRRMAREKGARIFIPSGAIAGIDGLKAASCGKIKRVTLVTTKPKKAFAAVEHLTKKNIHLDKIRSDTVIFEGSASSAVKAFPQNVNVSAVLSLAGIGPQETRVRIIASAKAARNIHQVEIESDSGRIVCRTENLVHPDNPKTSYLAVLSAVAMLKQVLDPVKIGT
ncbi:MAG: aspartate dehydrogenase [Candidatus Omnitrophica bacterium]|nr:aspartate dehydrogenase [Candidatus Omnitrophota bacterium]